MRFLIVKVSSIGDIIHAMPVVHDLKLASPGCHIDWVVEEAFTELVRANSQVDEVIPCGLRRWIKRPFNPANWGEICAFKRELSRHRYDAVFELQGLLKTAWICRQTNGLSYGFDRAAAKEPVSTYLLTHPVPIDTRLHIIEQLRSVPAQALGYSVLGGPVIEWSFDAVHQDWQLPTNAVVLFHMTAAAYKLWPVENWIALAQGITAVGLTPVLPWGSEAERARAQQIAAHVPAAVIAPRLTIAQWGKLLPQARAVVGLDTGLSHLAAARGAPTVFLFGATPLWRISPYWGEQHVTLGEPGHWPAASEVLHTVCDLIHRRARPRDRRTADSRDELGPSHARP